jgi:hypothetical protein
MAKTGKSNKTSGLKKTKMRTPLKTGGAGEQVLALTPNNSPERFSLSDDAWKEISRHVKLSDGAKEEIENCIGIYHHFKSTLGALQKPHEVRDALELMEKDLSSLLARLKNPGTLAWYAMLDSLGFPTKHASSLHYEEYVAHFEKFGVWLDKAKSSIYPAKTGGDPGNARWLVDKLGYILEKWTGHPLSRSNNFGPMDYVRAVFSVADPDVGTGTIDLAVKEHLKQKKSVE